MQHPGPLWGFAEPGCFPEGHETREASGKQLSHHGCSEQRNRGNRGKGSWRTRDDRQAGLTWEGNTFGKQ